MPVRVSPADAGAAAADCGPLRRRLLYRREFGDYESQRPTFARNFQHYLRRMALAGATRGRLLEVGCAYGFFLEQARASFDAIGLDVNADAIAAARRLGTNALCAEFLDYQPAGTFDVVCMWDTIEHCSSPGRPSKRRATC